MRKKLSTEEFIRRAREVHGDLYCYDETVYTGSDNKVLYRDPLYGLHEQIAYSHLKGSGHPKRSTAANTAKQRCSTEEFIEKARKVHGDLYCYDSTVYVNNKTPILVTDPIWGPYEQMPYVHLRGHGHPKRGSAYRAENQRYSTARFIEKARKVHGDLYSYDCTVYTGQLNKILIRDPDFGIFEQVPAEHLRGHGHTKRGHLSQSRKKTSTQERFISRGTAIHNGLYLYDAVQFVNMTTPVLVRDPIWGLFELVPYSHLRGTGHPKRAGQDYKYNYICEVLDSTGNIICLKYGIESTYEARTNSQNKKCIYEVKRLCTFVAVDNDSCTTAEKECKKLVHEYNLRTYGSCGVLTKEQMLDGFTETAEEHFLQTICDIYEKHGAVLLSPEEHAALMQKQINELTSTGKMNTGKGK